MSKAKVNIGASPPAGVSSVRRYDELIEAALANKGEWVSIPVDEEVNTNHYALLYRKIAMELGVSVKTSGDTLYVFIPK